MGYDARSLRTAQLTILLINRRGGSDRAYTLAYVPSGQGWAVADSLVDGDRILATSDFSTDDHGGPTLVWSRQFAVDVESTDAIPCLDSKLLYRLDIDPGQQRDRPSPFSEYVQHIEAGMRPPDGGFSLWRARILSEVESGPLREDVFALMAVTRDEAAANAGHAWMLASDRPAGYTSLELDNTYLSAGTFGIAMMQINCRSTCHQEAYLERLARSN